MRLHRAQLSFLPTPPAGPGVLAPSPGEGVSLSGSTFLSVESLVSSCNESQPQLSSCQTGFFKNISVFTQHELISLQCPWGLRAGGRGCALGTPPYPVLKCQYQLREQWLRSHPCLQPAPRSWQDCAAIAAGASCFLPSGPCCPREIRSSSLPHHERNKRMTGQYGFSNQDHIIGKHRHPPPRYGFPAFSCSKVLLPITFSCRLSGFDRATYLLLCSMFRNRCGGSGSPSFLLLPEAPGGQTLALWVLFLEGPKLGPSLFTLFSTPAPFLGLLILSFWHTDRVSGQVPSALFFTLSYLKVTVH